MNEHATTTQFLQSNSQDHINGAINVDKFRIESFETIKSEFEKLTKLVKRKYGMIGQFFQVSDTKYTCKIINKLNNKQNESNVVISMSNGIGGIADLSFDFNKVENGSRKTFNYSIIPGEKGFLLKDKQQFNKYSYKAGTANQLATEMRQHFLKLIDIG